jgi:predicted phosphate transport protein (TIGR00153 family)
MFSLVPKEQVFFDLFEQAAKNVHDGALALAELLENFRDTAEKAKRIKDIEHAGDKITHTTIEKLNKTFITPLEREDIHELICRLDDILDLIDTATSRMVLYKIDKPTEDAKALGKVLVHATKIITELVPQLRNLKHTDALIQQCIAIHTQENEGDRIEQHALAALFENGHDPVLIIKWKDIYEDLESATDKCEDVANVVEGIVLKNA